ncbi:hypothetical protein AB0B43_20590 [Streptomyces nodosus]
MLELAAEDGTPRGTGLEPRHVENLRAKLKRLVSRGILTEPEPGLFTPPRPTPQAPTQPEIRRNITEHPPSGRSHGVFRYAGFDRAPP